MLTVTYLVKTRWGFTLHAVTTPSAAVAATLVLALGLVAARPRLWKGGQLVEI